MSTESLYKTLNVLKKYSSRYGSLPGSQRKPAYTQYQQQLYPHVQEVKEERQRPSIWTPIEFIFDILQRGQYMSANTAKQITRNVREGRPTLEGVPREAWEGLRGQEKGTYKTVMFGGTDPGGEEIRGWAQDWGDALEEKKGGKLLKGAIGFGLDVLLDPTTYIPGFGPTKAARSAAVKAGGDKMLLHSKKIAANILEEARDIVAKGANLDDLSKAISKGSREATQYMSKYTNKSKTLFKKAFNKEIRDAQKAVLRGGKAGQEVLEQNLRGARGLSEDVIKRYRPEGQMFGAAQLIPKEARGELKTLDEMIHRLTTEGYAGMGQRGGRFFGKEFAQGERYPAIVEAWDKALKHVQDSKIGGLFSSAWWQIANNPVSPVAWLKKAFNVRGPYEQMMALAARDIDSYAPSIMDDTVQMMRTYFKKLTDEDKTIIRDIMIDAQGKADDVASLVAARNLPANKSKQYTEVITKVNAMMQGFLEAERKIAAEGLIKPDVIGEISNYLPIVRKYTGEGGPGRALGSAEPGFTMPRGVTHQSEMGMENTYFQWLFGASPEEGKRLASKFGKVYVADIESMIMARAWSHSRVMQRADMIRQFREFGVNMTEAAAKDPHLAASVFRGEIPGMRGVKDPVLKDYLFDEEVAGILDRILPSTTSDFALSKFEDAIKNFTSWWRGWATFSPGFHFRNHYSNMTTLFLKHGMKTFNAKKHTDAAVGTVWALYGDDAARKFLHKVGFNDMRIDQILKTKYGGTELQDLAKIGKQRGVISRATMGFDIEGTFDEFMKGGKVSPNMFSRQFAGLKGSRELGNVVESQPRFFSFITDYDDVMKSGGEATAALDYAKNEAKKWFIDYGDLSPFEQKVMKNIVPFYTWIRKNIANQVSAMFQFTDMYSLIPKATRAVTGEEGVQMPDYMRVDGYIPLFRDDEGKAVRMFWPNLPYMDVNTIPVRFEETEAGTYVPRLEASEILHETMSSAHPLLKSLVETVGGKDIFYRSELGERKRAPRMMRGLTNVVMENPKVLSFLDGFLKKVGFEKGLNADKDKEGRLLIDAKLAKLLENNVLFLNRVPQFLDLPEYVIPALEEAKERVTGAKDDYEGIEETLQILSFYLGVKMKNLQEAEISEREAREIMEEAQKRLQEERKKSPGYEQRSMAWRRSQDLTRRKLGAYR